jgi:hypothetical protein
VAVRLAASRVGSVSRGDDGFRDNRNGVCCHPVTRRLFKRCHFPQHLLARDVRHDHPSDDANKSGRVAEHPRTARQIVTGLRDQFVDHLGFFHAGQSLIETLIPEGEAFMVDPEQVQDGSMEIAYMNRFVDDVVTEIVGFTVNRAALGATAGHPHGKAPRVVIATVVCFAEAALTVNRSAKLTPPDNQGVVKHSAIFQVLDQAVGGLVKILALVGHAARQIPVVVPVIVVNLNKADPFFDESASKQHGVRQGTGFRNRIAIQLEGLL